MNNTVFGEDMKEILFDAGAIQKRIGQLAAEISADYSREELVLVGILKGAVVFMSDLARRLSCRVKFDFIAVSSYGSSASTSGVVRITKDLDDNIEGKNVLIVEDIIDTGLTLDYLVEVLYARKPASLRVCCLLDKPSRRKVPVVVDYVGFEVPEEFVVGYGLDYNELYRQLPSICALKPEIYTRDGGDPDDV